MVHIMSLGLLYVVCRSKNEAKKIAIKLIGKRLIACANIVPSINSVFRWKGKIETARETLLLCKIRKKDVKNAEKEILKIHSYEVPCICLLDVDFLNGGYKKWLISEISIKK